MDPQTPARVDKCLEEPEKQLTQQLNIRLTQEQRAAVAETKNFNWSRYLRECIDDALEELRRRANTGI